MRQCILTLALLFGFYGYGQISIHECTGRYCNSAGANLRMADLDGANLFNANLEGADLFKANLKDANLEGASLKGANLFKANLEGANLEGANLFKANLEGANLEWVNLEGANLKSANLKGAFYNEGTRFPQAGFFFKPKSKGMIKRGMHLYELLYRLFPPDSPSD